MTYYTRDEAQSKLNDILVAKAAAAKKPNPDDYTYDYDKTEDKSKLHYVKPYPKIEKGDAAIFPEYVLGDVLLLELPTITQRQVFQPQDRFAFSPLPSNAMSIEGLALLGIIFNFARTKEGNKSLERVIIKYLDSCARIVESIQDACHSNWLTALNNQMLTNQIAHRIGLIDDAGYMQVNSHYRSVFDKMLSVEVLTIVGGNMMQGITTLVQGAKTTQAGLGGEQSEAGGLPAVIGMLAKAAV